MLKILTPILFVMSSMATVAQESIHEFTFKTIDGEEKSFADFKGKMIMIVNTASKCGFTSQYQELQKMHEEYGDKLAIIGFPANNFGGQEPGTNDEIANFCEKNYGVSFTMAEKVSVKGEDINEIFKWLTEQEGASHSGKIKWNFEKFILDADGKLVERFRSMTKPDDAEVLEVLGV